MPRSSAAAIAVIALLVASSHGCGDEGREGPPFESGDIKNQESLLITDSDVSDVGASTPYGVALRWWQALQRADVKGIKRSYATRISGKVVRRQILRFQPRFSQPIDPKLKAQGSRATMDVNVRTALPVPAAPNVTRIVDFPVRFDLLRKPAGWRLLVSSYRSFIRARPFPQRAGLAGS